MRFRTRFVFVSCLCVLLAASAARASTIVVDGGDPDHQNIFFADSDYSWTAATNNIVPFTLLSDAIITGADWWGGSVANAGGGRSAVETSGTGTACTVPDFTLTFYSGLGNLGTTPGPVFTSLTVVPTTQEQTGVNINATVPEYFYSASFGPLLLPKGDYLFGLTANLTGPITWGWETTPSGEAQHFQFNALDATEPPIGEWHAPPNALGFDLVGPDVTTPVPEPGTLSLVAIGIAGAALRRRRAGTTR